MKYRCDIAGHPFCRPAGEFGGECTFANECAEAALSETANINPWISVQTTIDAYSEGREHADNVHYDLTYYYSRPGHHRPTTLSGIVREVQRGIPAEENLGQSVQFGPRYIQGLEDRLVELGYKDY